MPKNTIGGKKHKQLKNNSSKHNLNNITMKDNSGYQYYALVEKYYGHNADVKFIKSEVVGDEVPVNSNETDEKKKEYVKTSKAIIRGNIAKKCRLKPGDIVLISIRDYDASKVDLLNKYTEEEFKYLLNNKFLKESFMTLVNNFESSSSSVKYSRKNMSINELVNNSGMDKDDVNIVFDEVDSNDITNIGDDDEDEFDNLDDI